MVLRIPFWKMIYSQIFHQILHFPSGKKCLLKNNIFSVKISTFFESNVISVKLAQILWYPLGKIPPSIWYSILGFKRLEIKITQIQFLDWNAGLDWWVVCNFYLRIHVGVDDNWGSCVENTRDTPNSCIKASFFH